MKFLDNRPEIAGLYNLRDSRQKPKQIILEIGMRDSAVNGKKPKNGEKQGSTDECHVRYNVVFPMDRHFSEKARRLAGYLFLLSSLAI